MKGGAVHVVVLILLVVVYVFGYAVGRSTGRRQGVLWERAQTEASAVQRSAWQASPAPQAGAAWQTGAPPQVSAAPQTGPASPEAPKPETAAARSGPQAPPAMGQWNRGSRPPVSEAETATARPRPVVAPTPPDSGEQQRRRLRHINITFAVSTLLLVAAATLFVGTFLPPVARLGGLMVVVVGLMLAGVLLHHRSERLRPAAVALAGAGLAMLPVLGLLLDAEVVHEPLITWLLTSVVGAGAATLLAVRLRSAVVAHLTAACVASTSLAGGATLRSGLVWSLAAGLVLSIGLCWWLSRRGGTDGILVQALRRQHPWLGYGLPAAALVIAVAAPGRVLAWGDLALLLSLAAVYAGSRAVAGGEHDWGDGVIVRAAGLGAVVCLLAQLRAPAHAMLLVLGCVALIFALALGRRRLLQATGPAHTVAEPSTWAALAVACAAAEPAVAQVPADGILALALLVGAAVPLRAVSPTRAVATTSGAVAAALAAMFVTFFEAQMWPLIHTGAAACLWAALSRTRRIPAAPTGGGSARPTRDLWQAGLLAAAGTCTVGLPWTWTRALTADGFTGERLLWLLAITGVLIALLGLGYAWGRVGARDAAARAWLPATGWAVCSAVGAAVTVPADHLWTSPWLVPLLLCTALMLVGARRLLDENETRPIAQAVVATAAVLTGLPALRAAVHPSWVVGVVALLVWAGLWVQLVRLSAPYLGRGVRMLALLAVQALVSTALTRTAIELAWGFGPVALVLVASLALGALLRVRLLSMGRRWDRVSLWCTGLAILAVLLVSLGEADRFACLSALGGLAVAGVLERPERIDRMPSLRTDVLTATALSALTVLTDAITLDRGLLPNALVPAAVAGPALAVAATVMLIRGGRRVWQADSYGPDGSQGPVGAVHRRAAVLAAALMLGIVLAEVGLLRAAQNGVELGAASGLIVAVPWACAALVPPVMARRLGTPGVGAVTAPALAWALGRGVVAALGHTGLGARLPVESVGPLVLMMGVVAAAATWAGSRRTLGPESLGALGTVVTVSALALVLPGPAPAVCTAAVLVVVGVWAGLHALVRLQPEFEPAVRQARWHLITLVALLLVYLWFRLLPPTTFVETATRLWWSLVGVAVVLACVAVLDRMSASRWSAAALHTMAAVVLPAAASLILPGAHVTQLLGLAGFAVMVAAGLLIADRVLLWWGAAGLTLSVMYALSELFFLWLVLAAVALFVLGVRQLQRSERRD